MSSPCDIINLPIEILDLVFKYIPVMRDKLNLAKSHCVLGKAFAFHAGNIFKEIEIENRPIEDWSDILSLCGSSVNSIRALNYYNRDTDPVSAAKLASKHCPNLEKFSFRVCSSSWNQLKSLLLTLQNLSYIELRNCSENVSVVDALLQMPKLKHLQLYGVENHFIERVGELSNLTKLTMQNIEPIDFFRVSRSLKNIESLEINTAVFQKPNDLGDEQLLPKIELLKINYGIFQTPLPYLPSLKHLCIRSTFDYNMNPSKVFGESVLSYGKTLESLSFRANSYFFFNVDKIGILMKLKALKKLELPVESDDCFHDISQLENLEELSLLNSKITNRGAIMVINGCKKLQKLKICDCEMVNRNMIKAAVAALQHCSPRSDKPFLLRVSLVFGHVDKVS
ncbi:hypothetical protein KR059_011933 [Drosophila kikkawai]|nr:hypothetical protein KR059_011933 [Drosophila kikkawai]